MSVFSLETKAGNPVTVADVDEICAGLGVTIKESEKEEYKTLLAVFHESMESLMALPGMIPTTYHFCFWPVLTQFNSRLLPSN